MESSVSAQLCFPFITFSFGCATPFCRNRPFARRIGAPFSKSSVPAFFPSVFFPSSPFFRYGHDTFPIGCFRPCPLLTGTFLCGDLLSGRTVFRFCSLDPRRSCVALASPFFTDFRTGVSPLMPTYGLPLSPYHSRLLVSCFFIIAFHRSNHHFSPAKIVCRRERRSCLDQWRSCLNLPLSSLAVLPAVKNKAY